MLRAVVFGRLGKAGHKPTLEMAEAKFREHFDHNIELYPDLRQMVCVVLFVDVLI